MTTSGLYERPRVSGQGSACERFELGGGAMTLGWSSAGDLLCIFTGGAGAGFTEPLLARLETVTRETGRLRLWLDLYDLERADDALVTSFATWLGAHVGEVREARAVVTRAVAARLVDALNTELGGKIEVLGDPESQAELYARFASGA